MTSPVAGAGTPVFETVLLEDGRIRLQERHLLRLQRSGVPDDLVAAARRILDEACARTGAAAEVLRLDVLACRVAVAPRPPSLPTPARLVPVIGFDPQDHRRELKTADRRWAERASVAATGSGGDDALLVSADGLVGETTRANVFVVGADGRVATPPVAGILPGVTRSWAVEQLDADERPVALHELSEARSIFLTTAGRGVVPVAALAGTPVRTHPVVAALTQAWREL